MQEAVHTRRSLSDDRDKTGHVDIADMLELLRMIARAEPIDNVLDTVVDIVAERFNIRRMVVCLFDDRMGGYVPHKIYGFPTDKANAIRRHAYMTETIGRDFVESSRVGPRCYYVRAEDLPHPHNEYLDYVVDESAMGDSRGSENDWHELDYISFLMKDRVGKVTGWLEIDEPADYKVPSIEVLEQIQVLTDMVGIAFENSKTLEDAIQAVGEAQGYLDLIVHDLGNMVNPLMYYLDKVQKTSSSDPGLSGPLRKSAELARSAKALVDNVRRMSEVKDCDSIPRSTYDLREVLVKCISSVKRDFPDRDIVVGMDCPHSKSAVVADEFIYDLFSNLLSNAVKYTEGDSAEIDIVIGDGCGAWLVRIEDRGIGIPDTLKPLVFTRFADRPENHEGRGLGLSVVSLLVSRYNGLIEVRDRVQGDHAQGTRVEVALPKKPDSENGS
jgi:signal transduction histidine kinase